MWPADDPREKYKRAEQRLRTILLGDGTYEPGVVHGEEQRAKVAAQLRVMREAIDGLTQHEAELAEELLNAAQRKTKARPRSQS
jgi:hypothetical protein